MRDLALAVHRRPGASPPARSPTRVRSGCWPEFLNGSTTDNFAGGGRLCISGQDVGSANQGSSFLATVLSASLATSNAGSQFLAGSDKRITGSGQSDGGPLNMQEATDYPQPGFGYRFFTPPSGGQTIPS